MPPMIEEAWAKLSGLPAGGGPAAAAAAAWRVLLLMVTLAHGLFTSRSRTTSFHYTQVMPCEEKGY